MFKDDEYTIYQEKPGARVGEINSGSHKVTYARSGELIAFFDGIDNMLNFVQTDMPTAKRNESSNNTGRGDFNSFDNYSEAMDTFRNHPDKVVQFDPTELRIKDANESGSSVDFDVVGDYIDMGRFMEGIPESHGTMHMGNARNRRVNIIINLTQFWGVNHKDITHRGERLLRLVDALEAGGVRTQITGINSDEVTHVEVIVKRHEEPLTITDLAVVSHPEFLRRILFRVCEYSETWRPGYGSSVALDNLMRSHPEFLHSDNNDEINIFICSNLQGIPTIDSLFDRLEKLLVWEISKPVPEVDAVALLKGSIIFQPNGMRTAEEISDEGNKIMEEASE